MADYIDRAEAIKAVCRKCTACSVVDDKKDKAFYKAHCAEIRALQKIPAADVKPVARGHWVERKHATMYPDEYFCRMALSCSVCGHEVDYGRGYGPNYCGNCGADMRRADNA